MPEDTVSNIMPMLCFACHCGRCEECDGSRMGHGACQCGCQFRCQLSFGSTDAYMKLGFCVLLSSDRNRAKIFDLYEDIKKDPELARTPGSSHNHQVWEGGYLHHVAETINIANTLYTAFSQTRPFPFQLAEAVDVLFLHDIEKPWKVMYNLLSKESRAEFRHSKLLQYEIELTPEQQNALAYCEGEHSHYSPKVRTMNPMAAFCNMCDVASARIWFDKGQGDSW